MGQTGIDAILKIILFLIGFSALLFLTYVTTRYIGRRQVRSMMGRNISIIETVMLGPDKRLHLVRAGKSYVLIATTAKSVEYLTTVELDEDAEAIAAEEDNGTRFDFRSVFEKYSGIYRAKAMKNTNEEKPVSSGEEREEPTFRKNLEKLRIILKRNRENGNGNDKDGVDDTNDKDETRS